jgi:hypothetical protein
VTTALLPHFRSRKAGKIAFANSSFSWDSLEMVGPYAITKQALAGWFSVSHFEYIFDIHFTPFPVPISIFVGTNGAVST